MAYIIVVNPLILSETGLDFQSVLIATCLASAIGTFLMAFLTNYPFALAPGMGINTFFTYTVVLHLGYTWQQALAMVFVSGLLLVLLTASGWRKKIVYSIPPIITIAIPVGIGLFILMIGLRNAELVYFNPNFFGDFITNLKSGSLSCGEFISLGNWFSKDSYITLAGLVIMIVCLLLKLKGALFYSIIGATIFSINMGYSKLPDHFWRTNFEYQTWLAFDWEGLFLSQASTSFLDLIFATGMIILTFSLVDLLDTVGTLLGTASKGNFLDKDGRLPKIERALFADSLASTFGAMLGTSTVSTYIESGAGIVSGGRTGLTGVVVAVLFLVFLGLSPLARAVPAAATTPALVAVGFMMLSNVKKINWGDPYDALTALTIIIMIPITYSIANGIAVGVLLYTLLHAVRLKFEKLNPILIILSCLFLIRYIFIN